MEKIVKDKPIVLIVEDDEEISKLYSIWLSPFCLIRMAKDGADAWVSIKTLKPDIMIIDLLMPVIDGYIFLKMVNNDPTLDSIPVIMVTGAFLNFPCLKGTYKCDDCDLKPVRCALKDSSELQKYVNTLIFKPVYRLQLVDAVKNILKLD